jgi:hypothetical protein
LIINGRINKSNQTKVYLFKWSEVKPVKIDSTVAKEGVYRFQKDTQLPGVFFLTFDKSRMPVALFPDKDSLAVNILLSAGSGTIVSSTVTGSAMQTTYANYIQLSKALSADYSGLVEAYNKASAASNDIEMQRVNIGMKNKEKQMNDLELKMIEDNSSNLLSVFFLVNNRDKFDYAWLKKKMDNAPSAIRNNSLFTSLQKHLLKIKQ